MLSLGRRDDGTKGILELGYRSRVESMEENEVEEGEAFSNGEEEEGDEGDPCIDPDVALSYIDEKLQDVLGHFQKDFEGGVSAENLGAKFGGYGSFLPAYQRSPSTLSQPKSPPRPQNDDIAKSPYNLSNENPSVPRGTFISKNNTASVAQPTNSSKKENCTNMLKNSGSCAPQPNFNDKTVTVSDQKSLKVRIKVGPDNTLARSTAAIYSGLGLDASPFSSPEDSPDDTPGHFSEFRDARGESPLSILQVMTSFSVPGGYVHSPLHEHLFQLTENERVLNKKVGILMNDVSEMDVIPDMILSMRDMKSNLDKKAKMEEKNSRPTEEEQLDNKRDIDRVLKKAMDFDIPASKMVASGALNMPLQSCLRDIKAEEKMVGDLMKGSSRALGTSEDLNKPSEKGRHSFPGSARDLCMPQEGAKISDIGNIGTTNTHDKVKLNSKTNLPVKDIEDKSPSNHKNVTSDVWRDGNSKNHNSYSLSKLNGNESVGNDYAASNGEPTKQISIQKVTSHEDADRMFQGNEYVHEGKKGQKRSLDDVVPFVESKGTQGNLKASLVPKDKDKKKRKSSHARGDHHENRSKVTKPHKETNKGHSKEAHRGLKHIHAERVENKTAICEPVISTEKSVERPGVKKDTNLQLGPIANTAVTNASMCAAPTSDVVCASDAPPLVIKENWVCCDICQKWRLLPYGHDPDNLPKKWMCSMQVWMPGLNKCSISEDETTKAFNALYLVPAHETGSNLNGHHDVAALSITSSDPPHYDQRHEHDPQSVPTSGKRKSGLIGSSIVPNDSVSKKNLLNSVKSRSLTDATEYPHFSSKSIEFTMKKHNDKLERHEHAGCYSDGGVFLGKSGKYSKSKSRREINQDESRTSKKIKKENADHLVEDRLYNPDMTGKTALGMANGFSDKITPKILHKYNGQSFSKDLQSEQRGNSSEPIKKSKQSSDLYLNGGLKDHSSTDADGQSGTFDHAAKKRKVKEWQENQVHQGTIMNSQHTSDSKPYVKEPCIEGELRREKKARVLKSEGKEFGISNDDRKIDKKGRCTKTSFSGSREKRSVGMGDEGKVGRREQTGYQDSEVSQNDMGCNDLLKRDAAYAQLSTAATSSSSKVSSSCRSKANLQEVKGSPVESVSSSPLRMSTKKISIRRNSVVKDDTVHLDSSFMGSPKRCSDGELGSDQSETQRKETGSSAQLKSSEILRTSDSGVLDSVGGASYLEKEVKCFSGGNSKDGLHFERVAQVDLAPAGFGETNIVVDTDNISVHDNKYLVCGPKNDHICNDQEDSNKQRLSNGKNQRKSDTSSSGFKERNRSSSSDAKRNLQISESVRDQKELYPAKNDSSFHSQADVNINVSYNHHEDSKDTNCYLKEDVDYLGKKNSSVRSSRFDRRDNHYELEEHAQDNDLNSRTTSLDASGKSNLHKNRQQAPAYQSDNPSSHSIANHIDRSYMPSGKSTSQPVQPLKDKRETHSSGPQTVPTSAKGSRSDTHPTDVGNGDVFKLAKQSRKPDSHNGLYANSLRQATPNGHDSSPMRKDFPHTVNSAFKEARDLKHTANHVKNEGKVFESIGLYFEAALKYLYGSYLLEPRNADSARHGEMISSAVSMYADTAKLCEYCAHEYERHKEMAAAALAYKCIEVAYMKVAYYNQPAASKDRAELLTAFQAVPGESPSSSASDIDNLNNQGTLDKPVSTKTAGSPLPAGNCVIAARNRPSFTRLLDYINYLNSAFEATKRSQHAIAAASVSLEKDGRDGISSVKQVLDFNFHNVEGLLKIVRLSMESIGC